MFKAINESRPNRKQGLRVYIFGVFLFTVFKSYISWNYFKKNNNSYELCTRVLIKFWYKSNNSADPTSEERRKKSKNLNLLIIYCII